MNTLMNNGGARISCVSEASVSSKIDAEAVGRKKVLRGIAFSMVHNDSRKRPLTQIPCYGEMVAVW